MALIASGVPRPMTPRASTPGHLPEKEEAVGSGLKRYNVVVNGVKTQMKLNARDAEVLGAAPVGDRPAAPAPPEPDQKQAPVPRDKARAPSRNKDGAPRTSGGPTRKG